MSETYYETATRVYNEWLMRCDLRRAAKTDRNHAEVVAALRAHRCDVLSLAAVGDGCPDLLVWSPWTRSHKLLEVKDGAKPPSARKLTDDQVKFHAKWSGPIHVVTSVDEALRAVGVPDDAYFEVKAVARAAGVPE